MAHRLKNQRFFTREFVLTLIASWPQNSQVEQEWGTSNIDNAKTEVPYTKIGATVFGNISENKIWRSGMPATIFPLTKFVSRKLLIVVLVVAINFVGDALRDALDPNSEKR